MAIKLQVPNLTELRPRIVVFGVGGAGGNAINNMIAQGLKGVDFVVANTDAQALAASSAEHRIQLGVNLTEGLGAGSKPEIGEAAAEEAIDEIRTHVSGTHMVFVAAGMGGGTGTGAAAVIARVARELGVLSVGVVTKPFHFEGNRRMRMAEQGIAELRKFVDTLIVIPNQNLFRVATEKTTFAEAFLMADEVLHAGIACVSDLIVREGLINLDFADVRTVLSGMGSAMMGTGEAAGERRAVEAAETAILNPLLDDISLKGAKGLLLSISGSRGLTLYEVNEAATRVRQEVDPEANIIVGATFDDSLGDRVRVSIVASGLDGAESVVPANVNDRMDRRRAHAAEPAMPVGARPFASEPVSERISAALGGESRRAEPSFRPIGGGERREAVTERGAEPNARRAAAAVPAGDDLSAMPEIWQGPGDVVIELGAPKRAAEQGSGRARQSPGPAAGFSPEPPAGTRRTPRRMPEVADFPEVGQRAYRAHGAVDEPAVEKRLGSLFARLTGRNRESISDSGTPPELDRGARHVQGDRGGGSDRSAQEPDAVLGRRQTRTQR